MTARVDRIYGVEITSEIHEQPMEVIRNYISELRSQGHNIEEEKFVTATTFVCKDCLQSFRWYMPMGPSTRIVIFSDFANGNQCPHRQICLHGGF